MAKFECKHCGFTDEYEPDEFGLSYYQANGDCPSCGADTGLKEEYIFSVVDPQNPKPKEC